MQSQTRKHTQRNLIIFTVFVIGLAVLAAAIDPFTSPPDAPPGTPGLGQLIWILAPLGMMIVLRTLGGDGWDDFGLRPNFKGNGFWWLVNILILPVVILITVLIGVVSNSLTLDSNNLSSWISLMVMGLITAAIKNIFEEFAWRGYLAPKVYSLKMNIWLSHAIIGIIWGAWHLPFAFVLWPYLTQDLFWYFVPLLFLGTISQSVVYGEIRLATNSVLPAWLMHTLGNAIGNALLLSGFLTLHAGRELLASPGAEGVVSIVLMFIVGYWLHQRRKALEQANTIS